MGRSHCLHGNPYLVGVWKGVGGSQSQKFLQKSQKVKFHKMYNFTILAGKSKKFKCYI